MNRLISRVRSNSELSSHVTSTTLDVIFKSYNLALLFLSIMSLIQINRTGDLQNTYTRIYSQYRMLCSVMLLLLSIGIAAFLIVTRGEALGETSHIIAASIGVFFLNLLYFWDLYLSWNFLSMVQSASKETLPTNKQDKDDDNGNDGSFEQRLIQ